VDIQDFDVSNLQRPDHESLRLEDFAVGVLVIPESGNVGLGHGIGVTSRNGFLRTLRGEPLETDSADHIIGQGEWPYAYDAPS